jgi:hypothetical protein
MKVFLSWSGNRSKEVANLLSDWLSCVIQAIRPWISTRDLDRGSLWFGEINDQLKDTTVGIICLTQENKTRPWILFEAGALAKGLSTSRVCTLLIDLEPRDIEDPLAQFNHTLPSKESIHALVKTLNNSLGASGLDISVLDQVFETYWEQFASRFSSILDETKSSEPAKPRPKEDMLGEILENTRLMSSRIRRLEAEIDRGQERRLLELETPEIVYKSVFDMTSEGIPPDEIMKRLRGRAPLSILKEMISDSAHVLRGSEKV